MMSQSLQRIRPPRGISKRQIVKYSQRIAFEVDEASPSSTLTPLTPYAIDVALCLRTITREEIRVIEVYVEYVES